ncbi:Vps53-like protein [Dipodascopsis uninucleata]
MEQVNAATSTVNQLNNADSRSAAENGLKQQVMPSLLDPLDQGEYDPLIHLNEIFSYPESITSLSKVRSHVGHYHRALENKINELVAAQEAAEPSVQRVARAHSELLDIFSHIETVRERAVTAEDVITSMTSDIRKLDDTKRNLTLSMTMLKRLQMLTTAYEQLLIFNRNRKYKEAAQLLEAVIELVSYFRSYRSISQIAVLSRNIADLQRSMADQVMGDFESALDGRQPELLDERSSILREGCTVIEALGESYKQRLITWYCNIQLREYKNIFRGSDEAASLDNISRRYSYLRRMLTSLESRVSQLFPQSWEILEAICRQFCENTKEDYKMLLSRTGKALNVDLLLRALEETMEFEQFLENKFSSSSNSADNDQVPKLIFGRAMSEAFEPYLGLWVDSQDRKLSALMTQYSNQMMIVPNAEDEAPQQVLPSSADLFLFYRQTLAQSSKISTGSQLLNLSKTFRKYLQQYADRILSAKILDKITSEQEVRITCLIISTAYYCNTTTEQLEQRISDVIDEEFKSSVDFEKEKDAFLAVASSAVQSLVRKCEIDCKPAWREMVNSNWGKLEAVGDQSGYITELIQIIESNVRVAVKYLSKDIYIRLLCDRIIESTINTYLSNVNKCKPLTEICCEQMLLDCYVLKKSFLRLTVIHQAPEVQPSASYSNLVNRATSRLESLLKAIMTGKTSDLPDNLKVYLPTNFGKLSLPEKFRWGNRDS